MQAPRHTVIVGSGIVGACSAYYLARRGQKVTLLDQDSPATSASAGNAGIVALGHPPLPRPGLARKALRWMFAPESPLYIPPRIDPGLFDWFLRFWRACDARQLSHSMQVLARLGHRTMECWEQILAAGKVECHWQRQGWLDVYITDAGQRQAEEDAEIIARHGFLVSRLSRADLREREPACGDQVRGAVAYPESACLDPGRFLRGLLEMLIGMGVRVRAGDAVGHGSVASLDGNQGGARVTRLLASDGRCSGVVLADGERIESDRVVLAAGAWTSGLAAGVGVHIPLQAGKGYHLDLVSPDPPLRTACVLTESFVAVTPLGDTMRLAGTLEFSGVNQRLIPRRVEMLRRGASRCLPGVAEAPVLSTWCGLRPCTADGLPVVDWAPGISDLFIATGHAKMGLTLGPVTGRLVSECILDGRPSLDLAALSARRF